MSALGDIEIAPFPENVALVTPSTVPVGGVKLLETLFDLGLYFHKKKIPSQENIWAG